VIGRGKAANGAVDGREHGAGAIARRIVGAIRQEAPAKSVKPKAQAAKPKPKVVKSRPKADRAATKSAAPKRRAPALINGEPPVNDVEDAGNGGPEVDGLGVEDIDWQVRRSEPGDGGNGRAGNGAPFDGEVAGREALGGFGLHSSDLDLALHGERRLASFGLRGDELDGALHSERLLSRMAGRATQLRARASRGSNRRPRLGAAASRAADVPFQYLPKLFGRRFRRALPMVLVVSGFLLVAEAAVTVLWKEPFTALYTARIQSALGGDLNELEKKALAAQENLEGQEQVEAYMRDQATRMNERTKPGGVVGRLQIDSIGADFAVVQSTEDAPLKKGPGHYTETPLPAPWGNATVGIAGHRTTYLAPFRNIDDVKRGDVVNLTMPYGVFTYVVEGTKIVDDGELGVFKPAGYDRLALTACHPLYSDAQRVIAYAKLEKFELSG
jgi:sortase A